MTSSQLEEMRGHMYAAHRHLRMFLQFHPLGSSPEFRPIHSDVAMCRIIMAWEHGVPVERLTRYGYWGSTERP